MTDKDLPAQPALFGPFDICTPVASANVLPLLLAAFAAGALTMWAIGAMRRRREDDDTPADADAATA